MRKRRWRAPTARPGELLMRWGRLPGGEPDMCFAWGAGCDNRDSRLLHYKIACQTPDLRSEPLFSKMLPSLLEQLEARGYDLTTFRLSICKKRPEGAL